MSEIPHLSIQNLTKQYADGTVAVGGVNFYAQRGEFLTLLGPSGCGKTTALRMIAGLVEPTGGHIHVGGKDLTRLPTHQRNMGMVFQNYALFPHMTIAKNVAFGLEMRGIDKHTIAKRVEEGLALVRLGHVAQRLPKQLSGGQQQRVALARALVTEPSVLLLDEPLSNLDAKLREDLRDEIREIQRRLAITTVFVTHDQIEALTMSDRIAVMNGGKVEQIGTPTEIYEHPSSTFVATFIGRTNRIPATVTASNPQGAVIEVGGRNIKVPKPLPMGAKVTMMVRPHRLRLHAEAEPLREDRNTLKARVVQSTFAGEVTQYAVDIAGVTVMIDSHTSLAQVKRSSGDMVTVEWDIADTLVLDQ